MIAVRGGACGETIRFAGSRGGAEGNRQVSASGVPCGLRDRMHFTGMAQTDGQAARPGKSGGDTLKRPRTAVGNLPSAVSVVLKPLTAATKTLAGSEAGEHVDMGKCGK